ncbi:MAG: polyphosphate kinase 2 family protein, partial [Candidatus Firestonebacteria bacterium]|nr:polyphosphate kinase 2 family protein [Candidatus Firestonebacteria bacterium]
MDIKPYKVPPLKKIRLADYPPDFTNGYHDKQGAQEKLLGDIEKMAELQDVLYAQNQ